MFLESSFNVSGFGCLLFPAEEHLSAISEKGKNPCIDYLK